MLRPMLLIIVSHIFLCAVITLTYKSSVSLLLLIQSVPMNHNKDKQWQIGAHATTWRTTEWYEQVCKAVAIATSSNEQCMSYTCMIATSSTELWCKWCVTYNSTTVRSHQHGGDVRDRMANWSSAMRNNVNKALPVTRRDAATVLFPA